MAPGCIAASGEGGSTPRIKIENTFCYELFKQNENVCSKFIQ